MNLSLRNRVTISFVVANAVVILLGFVVFYFLNSLNSKIIDITSKSLSIEKDIDLARISAVNISRYQKRFLDKKVDSKDLEEMGTFASNFEIYLTKLNKQLSDPEIKEKISNILGYVGSLKILLETTTKWDKPGILNIGNLSEKIMNGFSDFIELHHSQRDQEGNNLSKLLESSQKNMLWIIVITFLGTILLGLVIPGKIALPFKKIKDAIRELQECNFDVSIYYKGNDEIGEIAHELNKMIRSLKSFEDLRAEKFSMEHRKFDLLANTLKRNILLANSEGELVYLNNPVYELLECNSEDVLGKSMEDSAKIPESIVKAFQLAIKRRSKIENEQILIPAREDEDLDLLEAKNEPRYKGYASIFPIRGKESSMDYYLMFLSQQVFS